MARTDKAAVAAARRVKAAREAARIAHNMAAIDASFAKANTVMLAQARNVMWMSVAAWALTVAGAAVTLVITGVRELVWGVGVGGRTGGTILAATVSREDALVLAGAVAAVPVLVCAIGWWRTRPGPVNTMRHRPPVSVSAWTLAGIAATLAAAPNVLGCYIASAAAPESQVIVVPQMWPAFAVMLGGPAALLWAMGTPKALRGKAGRPVLR